MKNPSKNNKVLFCGIFGVVTALFLLPVFFDFAPLGINVPLVVAGLYAALFLALREQCSLKRNNNWVLLIFIAACAVQFAIFNNGFLHFLNVLLLIILVSVQILLMTGNGVVFGAKLIPTVVVTVFFRPFHKIKAFYKELFAEEKKSEKKTLIGIIIGVAVCIPLFVILLLLLTSADSIFEKMVTDLLSWETIGKIVLFLILFVVAFTQFGSFSSSLQLWKTHPGERSGARAKFNFIAVLIITVTLSLLMLVFSAVQLIYLTGLSELPEGFQYSEYAREGFFQLCAAAAIIFAVIVICGRYTHHAEGGMRKVLNSVYSVLAGSVLMLLVSSFARMVMYEQEYRFTRLRLYTQAFMILLAVITVFVIVKIWCKKFRILKFVFYSVTTGLILLSYFNVDGFIARDAVEHARQTGGQLDFEYLSTLSVDALAEYGGELTFRDIDRAMPSAESYEVPFDKLEETEEKWEKYYSSRETCQNLRDKVRRMDKDDFRTWNLMRRRAEGELDGTIHRFLQNEGKGESYYFE